MAPDRYDYPYQPRRRPPARERRRPAQYRRPRRAPRYAPAPTYVTDFELRRRMGMHDLTERYGRYSGGPRYDYEHSERSIEHRQPRPGHDIGFTRPLHEPAWRRFPIYGRGPERRRRRRREW